MLFARVHFQGNRFAVSQPQRCLEAFSQPLGLICTRLEPVDHHINVVFLGLFQFGEFIKFVGCTVHTKSHIALRLHFSKQLNEFAFFFTGYRRQNHQLGVFGEGQRVIDHFAHALRLQRQIVLRAKRRTGACKEQT